LPRYFFDYFDGEQLHEADADDGIDLPDTDSAYLEAFQAATEMWGEAIRDRRNPTSDYFRVRDSSGTVVLEVPFAEILESSKGGRLARRPETEKPTAESKEELAWRHVAKGRRIVADQRTRVERLKEQGRNTENAERILALFTQSLVIFEDHLKIIKTRLPA
jgi:hypothetical protein